jgi:hypothetical protein
MIHPNQMELGDLVIKSLYMCPVGVNVRDVVYQTGAGTADTADCTGPIPKGPSIGVVIEKPTPTTCYVVQQGRIPGFPPATFIPKETLFMGILGSMSRGALLPGVPGTIIQEVGYAKSDTEVMVNLDRDWYDI